MNIQQNEPIGKKTTMRIGGEAQYYAELSSKQDCEEAVSFTNEKNIPLIILGGGSNTIFADGMVEAFVARLTNDEVSVDGTKVTVSAGKNLPVLINELAEQGLDLSALTGIPGSVGGALVGNAGQGPAGTWIDSFVEQVTVLTPKGWEQMSAEECKYAYRESTFKHDLKGSIVWEAVLEVPQRDPEDIKQEIEALLQKRLDTQPHTKTSGSCFKAIDGVPAWMFIDKAGLRGEAMGGVHVSEKHANFLINDGNGSFDDAVKLVQKIEESVERPLDVEMQFIKNDGSLEF